MTKRDLYDTIVEACVDQIDTSFYAPAAFTVVVDGFDESDGSTMIEIEGWFDEEYGTVSFYDIRCHAYDDDGNEVETEVSRLLDEIGSYEKMELEISGILCPKE